MKLKLKPLFRDHQHYSYRLIMEKQYCLIIHFMRAGKTLPTAKAIKDLNKRALVVCPPNVKGVWEEQLRVEGVPPENYFILSMGLLQRSVPNILFEPEMVVIDEIHSFANYSNRFKNLKKLIKGVDKRVGLSATPFESDIENIFYLWQTLDQGKLLGTNRSAFRETFCDCINPRSDFPKFKLKAELKGPLLKEINRHASIFRPKEIRPPKIVEVHHEITDHQRYLLDYVKREKGIPEACLLYTSPSPRDS